MNKWDRAVVLLCPSGMPFLPWSQPTMDSKFNQKMKNKNRKILSSFKVGVLFILSEQEESD